MTIIFSSQRHLRSKKRKIFSLHSAAKRRFKKWPDVDFRWVEFSFSFASRILKFLRTWAPAAWMELTSLRLTEELRAEREGKRDARKDSEVMRRRRDGEANCSFRLREEPLLTQSNPRAGEMDSDFLFRRKSVSPNRIFRDNLTVEIQLYMQYMNLYYNLQYDNSHIYSLTSFKSSTSIWWLN